MHFCIGIHYAKLFWSRKNPRSNHEILMLFEHGFYLTKPIWALICLHELHGNVLLPWLIAYGIFTLNSIFQPKAFIKKNMHFNINYIVSVPPFSTCFYWCVTSLQHEGNSTTWHRFSRKSGRNTCFMLTLTSHEILHAHKSPKTNNNLHSHTYLHDNTALRARNKSSHLLSIYSLHAQWN